MLSILFKEKRYFTLWFKMDQSVKYKFYDNTGRRKINYTAQRNLGIGHISTPCDNKWTQPLQALYMLLKEMICYCGCVGGSAGPWPRI